MAVIEPRDLRDPNSRLGEETPATNWTSPSTRTREERTSAEVITGGSLVEAAGDIAVVVLAIIGLAQFYAFYMAGIGVLVLGAALLLQGGAIAARFSSLLSETTGGALNSSELGSGLGTEFLGGAAGIVLGILSLLNIYPAVLLPVAAIVFGATLLLSCGTLSSLNSLHVERRWGGAEHERTRRLMSDMVMATNGAQALVGLAGIVLGIIALVNMAYVLALVLVALLCMGAAVVLSGSTISGKMMTLLRR